MNLNGAMFLHTAITCTCTILASLARLFTFVKTRTPRWFGL